jgi:hypothetical protein
MERAKPFQEIAKPHGFSKIFPSPGPSMMKQPSLVDVLRKSALRTQTHKGSYSVAWSIAKIVGGDR